MVKTSHNKVMVLEKLCQSGWCMLACKHLESVKELEREKNERVERMEKGQDSQFTEFRLIFPFPLPVGLFFSS